MERAKAHPLTILTVVLLVGIVVLQGISLKNSRKPAAPKEAANLFTAVYEEIADHRGARAVFLQPDDFGARMAVVDDYLDSPHICLYTRISASDAADARAALETGAVEAVLEKLKYLKGFVFFDRDRNGFVQGCVGDQFFFVEGGLELGEKKKGGSVLASEPLDPGYLDKLNSKYLAVLREIAAVYLSESAVESTQEYREEINGLSAVQDAIDAL